MRELTNEILELIRRTSSSLPKDVDAHGQSKHSLLDESSSRILEDLLSRPYQV